MVDGMYCKGRRVERMRRGEKGRSEVESMKENGGGRRKRRGEEGKGWDVVFRMWLD